MTQATIGKDSDNGKGPGAVLRQAREERGLTVDDVARSLNLTPQRIQSLEDDAYDRLPGPTYVRGYLRSYSQLLGLAVQPLLDVYNQLPVAAQRNELIAPTPAASEEVSNDDVLVKVGVIGIGAVVIGLAVLWWSDHSNIEPAATERTVASAPVAEPAPQADPQAAAPAAPATTSPDPGANKAAPSPAVAAPQAPATAPADTNVAHVNLVLRVRDDSWADVRDAADTRLLYQTLVAGRVVSVQGVPPLKVFLGNVEGVDVEFNGKPYDAARHKRGEVARFTLGTAPSP